MSFSSDIKTYLKEISAREKHQCCRNSYESGLLLKEYDHVCQKDAACFVRGVFVKSGFISPPESSNGLTMTFTDDFIFYVSSLLEEAGIEAKTGKRKNKYILYYKESEKTEDFLAFIGASKYALQHMEKKVIKELRSNANRLRNAETANLDRTARAAAEQCEAISILMANKEYAKLPSELKECADLRIANPDLSLEELRRMFSSPISKSGLNHRLARLIELSKQIKH